MPYDVRAIANLVLDEAERAGYSVSNMKINKIVYFLHVDYLVTFGGPLVSAKIEAWEHGPVFRELYHTFKEFGEAAIDNRACVVEPTTGRRKIAAALLDKRDFDFLRFGISRYVPMSAAALRAESHVEGGPWDQVWNHDSVANPSMKITDESILDWYGRSPRH